MELELLQEVEVRTLGASLAALTLGLLRYTHSVHRRLELTFDILTDLHLKTTEQFRLLYVLPDYLRELCKSFGNALDEFHDKPSFRLPIPARYVIDTGGIIRAADVNAERSARNPQTRSSFCGR